LSDFSIQQYFKKLSYESLKIFPKKKIVVLRSGK